MIATRARGWWRSLRRNLTDWQTLAFLSTRAARGGAGSAKAAHPSRLARTVLGFVDSMRVGPDGTRYRYSRSCTLPTLYASACACMIRAMWQVLPPAESAERAAWVRYFDSFQRPDDGLFYDPVVAGPAYADSDWWGARHLAVLLVQAYTSLGAKPRYPFHFLKAYDADSSALQSLVAWLDDAEGRGDGDNKIMNVGCLLQYQRDVWADATAGRALERLQRELRSRIQAAPGAWQGFDVREPEQRARGIQIAYHLLPVFLHDGKRAFDGDPLVRAVLRLQNRAGGFAAQLNSSACEDIDAIDVLLTFAPSPEGRETGTTTTSQATITRALRWVLANQMDDGGFVFRLHEPFEFGHPEMSSRANEGALFPTWFRLLSVGSMLRYLDGGSTLALARCPGYAAVSYRGSREGA